MWGFVLKQRSFVLSTLKSYLINLAFGLVINICLNHQKKDLPFYGNNGVAMAFASSAFFCGLLTPLLSAWFLRRAVLAGKLVAPPESEVSRSCFRALLGCGSVLRSLLLALLDVVVFGGPTAGVGVLLCLGQGGTCSVPLWVFLVVLVFWCLPVQIATSLLNSTAVAHRLRGEAAAEQHKALQTAAAA
eukprot:TRINITY_DN92994_c0_g1_i1.p1 TRINITY_DN92994_c0_g1~~TRINITY_DN92994_c0_g1_i1.p1  ORF type:complete len:204 (+),score=24.69 TRINITY_DN92994_c0_g1_i1:49-612(+)